jgi:hypothetical protein
VGLVEGVDRHGGCLEEVVWALARGAGLGHG